MSADDSGQLILEDMREKIKTYGSKIKVIAVTGASNLSGSIPPIEEIAELAHSVDALFVVDAAQLAPHRKINMCISGIDALAFSAHKLYAPFGIGVLALPKRLLERSPVDPAGGSIDMLSKDSLTWSPPTERHQTGTWNTVGIFALAESIRVLQNYGWNNIDRQEKLVIKEVLSGLSSINSCKLYINPERFLNEDRIGTIPFNLEGIHHSLLAAVLEHEYGIEVRAGTICNHRLVARWLKVNNDEQNYVNKETAKGNRLASYGVVRASIGIQNSLEDAKALTSALKQIYETGIRLRYTENPAKETFEPDTSETEHRLLINKG